jgi:hypothetical protein
MIRYVTTVFVIALALGASTSLLASPPIGAVVQTWNYDPKTNSVILKVVNTSHKDITAFNVSIKETLADGRIVEHEMLEEFLGKILSAKEIPANDTRQAEAFRKLYGDGALHPGEVHDEIIGMQPGFISFVAVVDVVTYIDGTAESTNDDGLGRIVEERQVAVASTKIITAAIQTALADPNDTNPAATAAKAIQDRANVWKAQKHSKRDLDMMRLESSAKQLSRVSSQNGDKRAALQQIGDTEQAALTILSAHATLTKTGGPQ